MSKIVARTLDFLEVFAVQKRPLSASEIARLLDIPASSCHDVLQALLERGYLYELTSRGGYYPTLKLYEIAKTIADHDPVAARADSILRALRDKLDESILREMLVAGLPTATRASTALPPFPRVSCGPPLSTSSPSQVRPRAWDRSLRRPPNC